MDMKEFVEKWSKLEKGYKYSPDDIIVYIGNDGNLIYANAYECVQGNVRFFEDDEYRTNIGEFRLEDIRDIKLRWE
jgi:hypothetical protein